MRRGSTDRCRHSGCPVLLRWNGATWVHALRATYDHAPAPSSLPDPGPAMPAGDALASILGSVR